MGEVSVFALDRLRGRGLSHSHRADRHHDCGAFPADQSRRCSEAGHEKLTSLVEMAQRNHFPKNGRWRLRKIKRRDISVGSGFLKASRKTISEKLTRRLRGTILRTRGGLGQVEAAAWSQGERDDDDRHARPESRGRTPGVSRPGGVARLRRRAGRFLRRPRSTGGRVSAEKPGAARPSRRTASTARRVAPRAAWQADRPGRLHGLPARDRLPGAAARTASHQDRRRRSRDRRDRRPAARRADLERPLRAQRRQRALGQPLRRALRHRRDPRGPRRDQARHLQSRARRPRRRGSQGRARPRSRRWPPARTRASPPTASRAGGSSSG